MKNWKTTLGGFLGGGGLLFATQFPQWQQWGLFAPALGQMLTGMAARDYNVSSAEMHGLKNPAPPGAGR